MKVKLAIVSSHFNRQNVVHVSTDGCDSEEGLWYQWNVTVSTVQNLKNDNYKDLYHIWIRTFLMPPAPPFRN